MTDRWWIGEPSRPNSVVTAKLIERLNLLRASHYARPPLAFRKQLREHGLKLILDFVPNHLALDHPWLDEDPELFVHGLVPAPESFPRKTMRGFYFFAHGKDPYFPAWGDTVQLDYRHVKTR